MDQHVVAAIMGLHAVSCWHKGRAVAHRDSYCKQRDRCQCRYQSIGNKIMSGKDDAPLVVLDPSCKWDKDIDKIAQQALAQLPDGKGEFGGVLFKNAQGEYCYSTFAGSGSGTTFKVRARMPDKESALAGLFHNHPLTNSGRLDSAAAQFSADDVDVANLLGVPSYIRTPLDIRKLAPGAAKSGRPNPGTALERLIQ